MKYILILLIILSVSCNKYKNQNEFINYDCNIPIIECVVNGDSVDLIVDTGAEYSLINTEYYYINRNKFRLVNTVETEFHGIAGTNNSISDIIVAETSLGHITFIEQDLSDVVKSKSQYKIVGVLGADFLRNNHYIVDFKMRKLYPYQQLDSIYGKSIN